MDRYFKALDKIRELEAEIQRRAEVEVALRSGQGDTALTAFVQKIADTKSKFAKEAKELLK